jgi:hypothetical protein
MTLVEAGEDRVQRPEAHAVHPPTARIDDVEAPV